MKAQPLKIIDGGYAPCEPVEATHLQFNFPGPIPTRIIPVMIGGTRRGTGNWTWNGDTEKPTIRPSVLTKTNFTSEGRADVVCHSWINDGRVEFLSDCTHELAGQTVDLLDIDAAKDGTT